MYLFGTAGDGNPNLQTTAHRQLLKQHRDRLDRPARPDRQQPTEPREATAPPSSGVSDLLPSAGTWSPRLVMTPGLLEMWAGSGGPMPGTKSVRIRPPVRSTVRSTPYLPTYAPCMNGVTLANLSAQACLRTRRANNVCQLEKLTGPFQTLPSPSRAIFSKLSLRYRSQSRAPSMMHVEPRRLPLDWLSRRLLFVTT